MSRARFVLGIDTAGREGSIALAEEGSALAWEMLAPGEHSSGISRSGERLLQSRNVSWRDLAAIAVVSGPGSFTGLRIGLAWAKGVCFGSRAKLILVPAHEATAYRRRGERGLIATVLQGERGEAQCALWSGGEGVALLWGPESVAEQGIAERLRSAADSRVGSAADSRVGSAAPRPQIAVFGPDLKPGVITALREAGFALPDAASMPPTAAAVAELGDRKLLAGVEEDLARSAPAYGREPNARKPRS